MGVSDPLGLLDSCTDESGGGDNLCKQRSRKSKRADKASKKNPKGREKRSHSKGGLSSPPQKKKKLCSRHVRDKPPRRRRSPHRHSHRKRTSPRKRHPHRSSGQRKRHRQKISQSSYSYSEEGLRTRGSRSHSPERAARHEARTSQPVRSRCENTVADMQPRTTEPRLRPCENKTTDVPLCVNAVVASALVQPVVAVTEAVAGPDAASDKHLALEVAPATEVAEVATQSPQVHPEETLVADTVAEVQDDLRMPTNAADVEEAEDKGVEKKKQSSKAEGDEESSEANFAWMQDSADEAGSGEEGHNKAAPPNAREVDTLGQMLQLAETMHGRKDLTPVDILDICAAAARVRFYDPQLFQETLSPLLLQYLKDGIDEDSDERFGVDQTLEVFIALAKLNAASALNDVFLAGAKSLRERGAHLTAAQRKTVKDIFTSVGRERDVFFLSYLVPCAEQDRCGNIKPSLEAGFNSEGLPMKPGARICDLYSKVGVCNVGLMCRNDHPEALRVRLNSEGYPLRPWMQICSYYLRMGTCDYKKTCKWHHPDKKEGFRPRGI